MLKQERPLETPITTLTPPTFSGFMDGRKVLVVWVVGVVCLVGRVDVLESSWDG